MSQVDAVKQVIKRKKYVANVEQDFDETDTAACPKELGIYYDEREYLFED